MPNNISGLINSNPLKRLLKFRCPFHNPGDIDDIKKLAEKPFYNDVLVQYQTKFGHSLIAEYLLLRFGNGTHNGYYWVSVDHFDLQAFQGSTSTETRAIVTQDNLKQGFMLTHTKNMSQSYMPIISFVNMSFMPKMTFILNRTLELMVVLIVDIMIRYFPNLYDPFSIGCKPKTHLLVYSGRV